MLMKALSKVVEPRTRYLAMTAGGMGALLLGRKMTAISLFSSGMIGMERLYREENDFHGSFAERWDRSIKFYEETHSHDTNRMLHIVGIPIIVGGTVGLLAFRPPNPLWFGSAGAFIFGWTLNFIGHGIFEKSAPAFQDDPLSFVAGPVWDLDQFRKMRAGNKDGEVAFTEAAE